MTKPILRTTIGRLLVNETLPEDMRSENRVLDKQGIKELLRELAQKHPEKYRKTAERLNNIARRAAYMSGGYSFGLEDLRKAPAAKDIGLKIKQKLSKILEDPKLSDEQRESLVVRTVGAFSKEQQNRIFDESWAEHNPLAMQIVSGTRGNKMNLASLRGSDMLYTDHHDNVIPLPVLSSYSEGLSPAEYWAGAYGARKGTVATKLATANAGFLNKQVNQIAHRLLVSGLDAEDLPDTLRGFPVDVDDEDNEGTLLAADTGPYKRNTVLTPKIMRDLKRRKFGRVLIRSPIVGGAPDGGLYARDVGIRETGDFPRKGSLVGLTAAQALGEPLAQSQLSSKHSGGVSGEEQALSGFDLINALIQVPKQFKAGAAHSQLDGKVEEVKPGPAGGQLVSINGERHYIGPGYALRVKKGDVVEAGDVISEGTPNPAEVVKHKGVGEGRKYFIKAYRDAYRDAGLRANRRNVELLARGLINHVRLTEEMHDFVPDDVVSYSALERNWSPRPEAQSLEPKRAIGRYLERPYLHYSIGTKIRPSVVKELNDFGVAEVETHTDPPPFEAQMVRGMANIQHDPDWMVRLYGSGQKKSLLSAVHRGASSTDQGTSFVPGLAKAVDFGRTGLVRTPQKEEQERGQRFSLVSQGLMSQTTTNPTAKDKRLKFSSEIKLALAAPDSVDIPIRRPRTKSDSNYQGDEGADSGTKVKPAPDVEPSFWEAYDAAKSNSSKTPKYTGNPDMRVRPGFNPYGNRPLLGNLPSQMTNQFIRNSGMPMVGAGLLSSPQHMANLLRGSGPSPFSTPAQTQQGQTTSRQPAQPAGTGNVAVQQTQPQRVGPQATTTRSSEEVNPHTARGGIPAEEGWLPYLANTAGEFTGWSSKLLRDPTSYVNPRIAASLAAFGPHGGGYYGPAWLADKAVANTPIGQQLAKSTFLRGSGLLGTQAAPWMGHPSWGAYGRSLLATKLLPAYGAYAAVQAPMKWYQYATGQANLQNESQDQLRAMNEANSQLGPVGGYLRGLLGNLADPGYASAETANEGIKSVKDLVTGSADSAAGQYVKSWRDQADVDKRMQEQMPKKWQDAIYVVQHKLKDPNLTPGHRNLLERELANLQRNLDLSE